MGPWDHLSQLLPRVRSMIDPSPNYTGLPWKKRVGASCWWTARPLVDRRMANMPQKTYEDHSLFEKGLFFQTIGLGETRWKHYSSCSSYRWKRLSLSVVVFEKMVFQWAPQLINRCGEDTGVANYKHLVAGQNAQDIPIMLGVRIHD